jgi:uncharacterized protein YlzI (FlbEa/FlbD family)
MIRLHKLNGQELVVNAEMIVSVEAHGAETVLALTTGNTILVKESITDVIRQAVEYKKEVYATERERSITCHSPSSP